MLTVDHFELIRRKYLIEGMSIRAISRELHHSRQTIRTALLDSDTVAALSSSISAPTLEWLHLLSAEHDIPEITPPQCARFRMKAPNEVNTVHVRQLTSDGPIFLCSTDVRFKLEVQANEQMPFDKYANDLRFVFVRDGNETWVQQCRDPRINQF